MKNIIITFTFLLSSIICFAQEYKKLNENIYELYLSKKPCDTIKILKNDIPTKLSAGKYDVSRNDITGLSQSLITINEYGLVNEDFIIKEDEGTGYVKVEYGVMSKFDLLKNDNLVFQFIINDSTSIERDYDKSGKLEQEEIIYLTTPNKGKKIVTHYYSDGYSINDEIKMVSTNYYLNGTLKEWVKRNEKNNKSIEEKHYLENGDLNTHIYYKKGIKYTAFYEEKQLTEKKHITNDVTYIEKYKNKKITQKIEEREISGGTETCIYNSLGKLIKKYNSWYPTGLSVQ